MRKDISFANAYGRFCAVIDIHKAATIAGLNGDVLNTTIEHTQSIQDTAISNYRACSLAEKEKSLSLPQEQKLLFQQMIVFPANLYDRLDQVQSEQAQMKKELANTRIKLNQFEKSASWRIGRKLTFVPRSVLRTGQKIEKGIRYIQHRHWIRQNKVIIQMRSRLGNQMFLFALYLKLNSLGREVSIDTISRQRDHQPGYSPDLLQKAFDITYLHATDNEILCLQDKGSHKSDCLRQSLFGRRPKQLHEIDDYSFDPRVLDIRSGYLTGWFQNSTYFEGVEDEIRRKFCFREIVPENKNAYNLKKRIIEDPWAVSVHLRFGDYLNKENIAKYGDLCTEEYYLSAIDMLQRNLNHQNCHYMFSQIIRIWLSTGSRK